MNHYHFVTDPQGPYVGGNRHGSGQLVKSDGEERNENYKEGKLVNFTVTKDAEWTELFYKP